ncbi:hypothetical protein F5Y19DRAFT_407341 [Xylariaceae sp. FL1651]|nr:hypothetical protein F5Y19DRAFT_407341 [Xylariaceae sp. FL1651]
MSPPLPVPSKAAIHALRGIALGTSCAIGVIVEDRRRRISTLRTAVANKEKLKSSRKYHHSSLEPLSWQLDDAVLLDGHNLQWHEKDDELRVGYKDQTTDDLLIKKTDLENHKQHEISSKERASHLEPPHRPELLSSLQSPPLQPSPSRPSPSQQFPPSVTEHQIRSSLSIRPTSHSQIIKTNVFSQTAPSVALMQHKQDPIVLVEDVLESNDEERLARAVSLFVSYFRTAPSDYPIDRLLNLSARLSKKCQASGRWEDASKILATTIDLGPLDESQYFAHDPLPIIEFHLRQRGPNLSCPLESVASAARLFLATFKKKPQLQGGGVERLGRLLMVEALSANQLLLAQHIYWRVLGLADNASAFVGWAIQKLFQYNDHRNVIKYFLLNYSRTSPEKEHFNKIVDCVVGSVQAMKGLKANLIVEAFARMASPGNGKLRTRWIMKLLQAHWARHEDLAKTTELLEKAVSHGLLDRITHPEGVYRTMVEISVKSGDKEMAHMYFEEAIRKCPAMKEDIALNGFLALFKAKDGDWDGVFQAFSQMQLNKSAQQATYDNAFILVLKIFASCHSVAETRDFVMLYTRDLGVGVHPYMVTLVANKYGECHDMKGFMTWLQYCSQSGFALDAGFCNSVLYNCWARWKLSFPELRMIHSKFQALNPHCSDEVTQRIMSQAAGRAVKENHRVRAKVISVNKMAYSGRSADKRDIYEAMNQELINDKPLAAVMIYRRAIRFGMPFCSHCLRLAVVAALRRPGSRSGPALSLIRDAHAQGHDVGPAVSAFIRSQIDDFHGSAEDVLRHMRNLIGRFESSQIVIRPEVLTHLATICVKIGKYEKAITLCTLARDRSRSTNFCFSRQSFKALSVAYSQILDFAAMDSLISDLSESQFLTDKTLLSHLKSIRRRVKKRDPSHARMSLLEVIERGIYQATQARFVARTHGKLISEETLRIVGNALANMQNSQRDEDVPQRYAATEEANDPVLIERPTQLIAAA